MNLQRKRESSGILAVGMFLLAIFAYHIKVYAVEAESIVIAEYKESESGRETLETEDVFPKNRIPEDNIIQVISVYLNGELYTGGNVTVVEGDNFSYTYSWEPNINQGEHDKPYEDGDWFEEILFKVPNLNFDNRGQQPLMINGIKTGEWELNYDKESGVMKYKVIFNRYIQFFDMNTIVSQLSGGNKFLGTVENVPIKLGKDKEGTLTIEKRPELPQEPSIPSGVGWKPTEPPEFSNNLYSFGKGVKWDSSGDISTLHEIDWRIVFFELLQKRQQAFLDGESPGEMNGYCIVEETLDGNQRFYDTKDLEFGAVPFHIELPVIAVGTDKVLNGSVGSYESLGNYDGPGKIVPYIRGADLQKIDGSKAFTYEEVQDVQKRVRSTPCSWTVTTEPGTKRETLLINLGEMGTTDPSRGITWDMVQGNTDWPHQELDRLIEDCENKIASIEAGNDSPINLLDARQQSVSNLLQKAVELEINVQNAEILRNALQIWKENYRNWRNNPNVGVLEPLEKEGELIVPLPDETLLYVFLDIPVNTDGMRFQETDEYKNFEQSFVNLRNDQRTYLSNRLSYAGRWRDVKKIYEKTKEFYNEKRIYGFSIKCRTNSINPTVSSYKNKVNIQLADNSWTAEDQAEIKFENGVIGSFGIGTIVMQKADILYDDPDKQPIENIQKTEADKAGIGGVKFQVYCAKDGVFVKDDEQLAHFLDKDASENGDTYVYTHTGSDHSTGLPDGEIKEVVTDTTGKIVFDRMTPLHTHYLVETQAQKGYYVDDTPIPINSDQNSVVYEFVGNVSRSVKLQKADSYSGLPISGAEFALYKAEQPVTGFVKKNVNGHENFIVSDDGKEKLLTDQNGELCIHGLDAGTYMLKEIKAAPGYTLSDPAPEYMFSLEEKLPKNKGNMDEQYHLLLNNGKAVVNDPGVAELKFTKQDGLEKDPLENAAYGLFRFKGTEEEWKEDPDREALWEVVEFNDRDSRYFYTPQRTGNVSLPNLPGGFGEIFVTYTETDGGISMTDIPVGHYSLIEIEAPDTYIRDYHSYYFDVNGDTVGQSVVLRDGLGSESAEVAGNVLNNYQQLIQIKLVKGDAGNPPEIKGDKANNGWKYEGAQVTGKGLPGAVYKLFMRVGASDTIRPNPKELTQTEIIGETGEGYDVCLAAGTTDEQGILELSNMTDKNGVTAYAGGLNQEEYYMIEVKAPEGYRLDQTPVMFSLNENVFPTDESGEITADGTPGLVMLVSNWKYDYGIKLIKKDAEDKKTLQGVGFSIGEKGSTLPVSRNEVGDYRVDTSQKNTIMYTDEHGEIFITGLKAGTTYSVVEEQPLQGYRKPKNAFEIKTPVLPEQGKVEDIYLYADQEIQNERLKGKAMLHKEDEETGRPLIGAEFELYYIKTEKISPDDPKYDPNFPEATRSEDVLVDTKTTDINGNVEFSELEWQSQYFLREKTAPTGYLLDETKLNFSIDETSFDRNGTPIAIIFPHVKNNKGAIREVILHKTDALDPNVRLADAEFFLSKKITEESGQEVWVGYGRDVYTTDANGEIRFRLPPGEYKLSEVKAPDGYLPLESGGEVYFTVEDTSDAEPIDIIVENHKGDAGFIISKILNPHDSDQKNIPVKGVAFKIYQKEIKEGHELLFIKDSSGVYNYTMDKAHPGAVNEVITDETGQIRISVPASFIPNANDETDKLEKQLWYEEIRAPENVVISDQNTGKLPSLVHGSDDSSVWKEHTIRNELSEKVFSKCKVTVHKEDGETKKDLAGAKFQLYKETDLGNGLFSEEEIGKPKITDKNGNLVFEKLKPGYLYHIKEIEAPVGYVLDERVHSVVIDETAFDEDYNFIPIQIRAVNQKIKGRVMLQKKDKNTGAFLKGAEFELFVKEYDSENNVDFQWIHYGEVRYVTDENGEISIELPYGEYYLIERAAPMGYELKDSEEIHFEIRKKEERIYLDVVNQASSDDKGSVKVIKTEKQSNQKRLSGAKFQLYCRGTDGEYYLRHIQEYVTDANGVFAIEDIPLGSYAFKEIAAPNGYLISDKFYEFSITETGDTVVVEIENEKAEDHVEFPHWPERPGKPNGPNISETAEYSNGGSAAVKSGDKTKSRIYVFALGISTAVMVQVICRKHRKK